MKPVIVAIVESDTSDYLTLKSVISNIEGNIIPLHFPNAKEAYNYLLRYASNKVMLPDYIFFDIEMPEMDGLEFLDKIRPIENSFEKDVIVYLISSAEQSERALVHPTLKGLLSKPISPAALIEIFNN